MGLLRTDAQSLWPLSRSRTVDCWQSCRIHSSHLTICPFLCRVPIRTRHPHLRCFPIWAQRFAYLHSIPTLPHGVLGPCFSPMLLPLSMSHSPSSFVLVFSVSNVHPTRVGCVFNTSPFVPSQYIDWEWKRGMVLIEQDSFPSLVHSQVCLLAIVSHQTGLIPLSCPLPVCMLPAPSCYA